LFSATPAGAGGISLCPGADGYKLTGNWICGNLSTGDGGGVTHLGYSENGLIEHNSILFNQSTNPTTATNGAGLIVMTTAPDGLDAQGFECGSVTDVDCGPGLGDGTGPGLVINANLVMGNAAESGAGGGMRFQGVNGTEVSRFFLFPGLWYSVDVTNNIIVDNVAGWDGAGVSLQDSLKVNLINNTIISNDSTASSGALFTAFRANHGLSSAPIPGCTTPTCLAAPQPAGVASAPNSAGLVDSLPALVICPAGHTTGLTNPLLPLPVPNGSCRRMSFPILYNNLIWQNRAFHLDVAPFSPTFNQSVVTLLPTLNQTTTGQCMSGANYWDVGVRGDTGPLNHSGTGVTLTPVSSVLTSLAGGYSGNHNSASDPTVVRQYCNGSRVPPENGGLGYLVPPGTNEGNVPVPVFNLTAGATVDEGNNWINISWGPLSLTNPSTGAVLGNYAPATGSPAINYISLANSTVSYLAAPGLDFFNNPRKVLGNLLVDVGAVEGAGAITGGTTTVSPTSLAFGNVASTATSAPQTLTLTNNTGATVTGITVTAATLTPGPSPNVFSRPAGAAGGTCGVSLGNGLTCTILVVFKPVAAVNYTGRVTISASVGILGQPVSLTGTGLLALTPLTRNFGTVARGSLVGPVQMFTLKNTGNVTLTAITQGVLGGTDAVEFTVVRAMSTCGPAGGGQTIGQTTLAPGTSCVVTVKFTPLMTQPTGAKNATVSVTDAAGAQTSTLTGTAN